MFFWASWAVGTCQDLTQDSPSWALSSCSALCGHQGSKPAWEQDLQSWAVFPQPRSAAQALGLSTEGARMV